MFAQLGATIFDGAKSFGSFSEDSEAVVVEHALMGAKARLQPAAMGLRNITFTLFLHQEFCSVSTEIDRLREYQTTFEVLPLLWGNGKLEGDFLLISLSIEKTQMDAIGNTISASLNITLIEYFDDDKLNQRQIDAQKNAFAVGAKTPPAKSSRVNPIPCSTQMSNLISGIKANAGAADRYCQGYTNFPSTNARLKFVLNRINEDTQKILVATSIPSSCAYGISALPGAANNVKSKVAQLLADIKVNETQYPNLSFTPVNITIKSHNNDLQAAVRSLSAAASPLIKSATIKR